jgi:hypothetical protein
VEEGAARDFTTHLELTGAFLWRHHESRTLLAPTQRAVSAAIQRAGWHYSQPDYFEKIAARTGLSIYELPPGKRSAPITTKTPKRSGF